MNKKIAQQDVIQFKQQEINTAVKNTLTDLNNKMQAATKQLSEQVTKELTNIVNKLQEEVNQKVNEIKSLMPQAAAEVLQTQTQMQTADDDKVSGGKGDDLDPEDVDKDELKKGIGVELEHTDDEDLAEEIALDHLAEDEKYYTKLEKVHKESSYDLPGVVKESKKKKKQKGKKKSKHSLEPMPEHPTPRGKEHTKELPDFWRRNFDYGESPYMNIGFIEKITDKVPSKKKKKKKSEIINELIAIADKLDDAGLTNAANRVDSLMEYILRN